MARPLTMRDKSGKLNAHPRAIEATIYAALARNFAKLRQHTLLTDRESVVELAP